MDLRLVARHVGTIAWLIGVAMLFSIPWAFPAFGHTAHIETRGLAALIVSIIICGLVGGLLRGLGRHQETVLYRKEAMAVVGLSWVLATVLGAFPFWLSRTDRGLAITFRDATTDVLVEGMPLQPPSPRHAAVLKTLTTAGGAGYDLPTLVAESRIPDAPRLLDELCRADPAWATNLVVGDISPHAAGDPPRYRVRAVPMSFVDSLFEAQSGFSTTGATVLTRIEDRVLVPRCILFWRSSTHFLGGLGIIVLFVAVLGQGSAGKALMRAEIPGPSKDGAQTRMQHTAWNFAAIYCLLNAILTILLHLEGMHWFDALCHAFGTMATGGFSTYDTSLGHFDSLPGARGAMIDYTVIVFMILAGSNFTLLYFLMIGKPGRLIGDVEWRTYLALLIGASALVIAHGMYYEDFAPPGASWWEHFLAACRFGTFQVVSIMTTTGFGTHNFDEWNSFGRAVLFLLMFVGGCAGSTGGGMKVIRHVLFLKILRLEVEHSFHPSVVRPLRLGGHPVEDPELRHNILVYFCLILVIFVFSWMFVVAVEPDETWTAGGQPLANKLIDSASSVSATLNNIGPGLGIVGATQNYAGFSVWAKSLFVFLMMVGRLEIFAILVLLMPSFWRKR
ncbi:MAG: TrkH family potassium uptake protein [Pirellulales bacterium]